jgi:hypothetical protein
VEWGVLSKISQIPVNMNKTGVLRNKENRGSGAGTEPIRTVWCESTPPGWIIRGIADNYPLHFGKIPSSIIIK